MAHGINIYSEIGKLNRVMLHRMGHELEASAETAIGNYGGYHYCRNQESRNFGEKAPESK